MSLNKKLTQSNINGAANEANTEMHGLVTELGYHFNCKVGLTHQKMPSKI